MKQVWYVRENDPDLGIPLLFETKMDAEKYARELFPDETPDVRYGRVGFSNVYTMEETK